MGDGVVRGEKNASAAVATAVAALDETRAVPKHWPAASYDCAQIRGPKSLRTITIKTTTTSSIFTSSTTTTSSSYRACTIYD